MNEPDLVIKSSKRVFVTPTAGMFVRVLPYNSTRAMDGTVVEGNSCRNCILKESDNHCTVYPCVSSRTHLVSPPTPERKQTMSNKIDLNAVALVRDDAHTLEVCFANNPEKTFRYLATKSLGLQQSDLVVTSGMGGYGVATVVKVDEEVLIGIGDERKFAWVVGKVDMNYYTQLQKENDDIETTLVTAYKNQAQRSFRNQILSGLSPEELAKLPASVTSGVGTAHIK